MIFKGKGERLRSDWAPVGPVNEPSRSRAARGSAPSLTQLLNERARAELLGSLNKRVELELLFARLG